MATARKSQSSVFSAAIRRSSLWQFVSGGPATSGGNGRAYGGGIFVQGDQTIAVAPPAGQTLTISDAIADMTGSPDASGQTGAGSVVVSGAGAVVLSADNTYTGGTAIDGGA